MKYKVGDKVTLTNGGTMTVYKINDTLKWYFMKEDPLNCYTDEMIEGLVERNGKTYPYKIGDRVVLKGNNRCATITDLKYNSWGNLSYYIKIDNDKDISIDYPTDLLLPYDNMIEELVEEKTKPEPKFKVGDRIYPKYHKPSNDLEIIEVIRGDGHYGYRIKNHHTNNTYHMWEYEMSNYKLAKEEIKSEDELLDDYEELTDRAFKGGYEKCKSDIELNGFQLPDGYIFKDERGNEIHALKIVLEKANTLKTQSDNMEIETHRGHCTTEPETTSEGKKVAWFTFWGNDFADKVELDLSNRELIQEDGKWFVVKKKKGYPKTYEECCEVLSIPSYYRLRYHTFEHDYHELATSKKLCLLQDKLNTLGKLLICCNAYWKIAGDEMGLDKPWEPDWRKERYIIYRNQDDIIGGYREAGCVEHHILAFPTAEMRDAFHENFGPDIENCKEFL